MLYGTSNEGKVFLIHHSQHMKQSGKMRQAPQQIVQTKQQTFISVSCVPVQLIVASRSVLVCAGVKDSNCVCKLIELPEYKKALLKKPVPPGMPMTGWSLTIIVCPELIPVPM